jgi:hypothetical protein
MRPRRMMRAQDGWPQRCDDEDKNPDQKETGNGDSNEEEKRPLGKLTAVRASAGVCRAGRKGRKRRRMGEGSGS